MASVSALPCSPAKGGSTSLSSASTSSLHQMSTQAYTTSHPRRFMGDDDRLREFSSFFAPYFESAHPQHDQTDTGTTQIITIDKTQQMDLFNRVAAEFHNHCRSPGDFEIVKIELLRNRVLWKRYQAEKAVRRELEVEKCAQQQDMRKAKRQSKSSEEDPATSRAVSNVATSRTHNLSYEAALKRQQQANRFPDIGSKRSALFSTCLPPRTAYFDAVLFHGTKKSSIPSILDNGLDPRTTTRSNYGQGIYFSDTVEKCMHYVDTQTDFEQVYSILLCCVLLGNVLINPFDKDQRHMTSDTLFLPPGFDSVCEMNPLKEFVVFEKPQVLPLCVISVKASNNPSSFWRICHPVLHSYPQELQRAQHTVRVAAPVDQQSTPQVVQPLPRITQPISTPPPPSTSGNPLLAAFGAQSLRTMPPLDKLGVKWTDIVLPDELQMVESLFNMRLQGVKKASCYLYGILYTLVAGNNAWNGQQSIVRITPASYDRMLIDANERKKMQEQHTLDCNSKHALEISTESRLRAEFDKNPAMHQLYPVGKKILVDLEAIKQELAKYPTSHQAIMDASTGQPTHITQIQLEELRRRNDGLLARQMILLEDTKKFSLEQQQWIIAMVEEEVKLAQMRQAHMDAKAAFDNEMERLVNEARERSRTLTNVMTLDELSILVKIAENTKNAQNTSATPAVFTFNHNAATGAATNTIPPSSTANRQTFELRTYNVTCWEAEAWPQMIAEMIMSRVLISKIQPMTFQILLSQTRKIPPFAQHSQAIQAAGLSGPQFFVAKNGWWYDAPRRHFQIPIAASRFWPVDPRTRLPNRSFQKLEDYILWAITKTEKRKFTMARNLEAEWQSRLPPASQKKQSQPSAEEALVQMERRIQDEFDALDPSTRHTIAGLSTVSGRVVFVRKEMEAFLEMHESNLINSFYVPATPDMIPEGSDCSVCLVALSPPVMSSPSMLATSSAPYNKANGVVQLDADSRVVKLKSCRHCFHETCITSWFHAPSAIYKCPICSVSCVPTSRSYGQVQDINGNDQGGKAEFPKLGPSPDGVMGYVFDPRMCAYYVWFTLPSHDIWDSTNVALPTRVHIHGENRFAIVPFSARLGPLLLIRMMVAFKFGHMFRVGRSLSRNVDNVITWNGIHCRTDLADRNGFGFPQPSYEASAWQELDQKHLAMGLAPLLEQFMGPQMKDKKRQTLGYNLLSMSDNASPATIVPTTIGIGPTTTRENFFDDEDEREVEAEMYDCEYDRDDEIQDLSISSTAITIHPTPSSGLSVIPVQQQQQQQESQEKTFDHWLDPNVNYFYDENKRELDNKAKEHAIKIWHAVLMRMDCDMTTEQAIEDVMRTVAGHDFTLNSRDSNIGGGSGAPSSQEDRLHDSELSYKSHQRFFDMRCPLMFG